MGTRMLEVEVETRGICLAGCHELEAATSLHFFKVKTNVRIESENDVEIVSFAFIIPIIACVARPLSSVFEVKFHVDAVFQWFLPFQYSNTSHARCRVHPPHQ